MAIGDNIRSLRRETLPKLSQTGLGEKVGVSLDTVKRWEKNTRIPRSDELQKIAAALGCSVSDLLEEGQPEGGALRDGAHVVDKSGVLFVPAISSNFAACAGNGNSYEDVQLEFDGVCEIDSPELTAFYSSDGLVAMRVEGDSMTGKRIYDGDWVICDKSPDWVTGLIYLVYLDGRLMVKGVISQGAGKPPVLKSANSAYQDIAVSEDNTFFVLGRVLEVKPRSFKPEAMI